MVGRRRVTPLLAAALSALFLFACGPAASSPPEGRDSAGAERGGYPVVVEDDTGRTIEISRRPDRLGSMAPSVTETVFALGTGGRLAGVTTADDYPAAVRDIEKIGGYREPNAEKVVALDIEVLFAASHLTTAAEARELEERTRAAVVVLDPKTVEGAISRIGLVGKIIGERREAEALERRLREDLERVRSTVRGRPEPTVFYELWDDPLQTVGPGSFVHDAIVQAGGENIAADAGEAYPSYSEEMVLKKDPDYYLASSAAARQARERPAYRSLTAVERGRVVGIDEDLLSRPGPRIVQGVRQVAEAIHPRALREGGG